MISSVFFIQHTFHRLVFSMKKNRKMSDFIKQKASPNILLHFKTIPTTKEQNFFIENIQKSVDQIYGCNRFIVYCITNNDLETNSRFFSAKVLLEISKNSHHETLSGNFSNIQKLTLDFNSLFPQFDSAYFSNQIKKLIPHSENYIQTKIAENHDVLFLFDDTQNIEIQSSKLTSLKVELFEKNKILLPNHIYLVTSQDNEYLKINFNSDVFFRNLTTNRIGRTVLFVEKTLTTMSLANRVKEIDGIVVIANYQTLGEGRNDNQWLSPLGCAMFTLNMKLLISQEFLKRIPFVQLVASLAIILSLPNSELNIKIKWPNDIIFGESMSKMAGILSRSFINGNHINIQIGWGVNVSNRNPSICLDEIIEYYNSKNDSPLKCLSKEEVIARILSNFENLFEKLYKGHIIDIKELYCKHWIHSDSVIDIYKNDKPNKARIIGIDDNGYLIAKDLDSNESLILHPDGGNRFDLMSRLKPN